MKRKEKIKKKKKGPPNDVFGTIPQQKRNWLFLISFLQFSSNWYTVKDSTGSD